jgi:carbonic anhydrase
MARLLLCAAVVALATVPAMGCGGEDDEEPAAPEFGYTDDIGPSNWGQLDPSYRACSEGRSQSPVDLGGARPAALPPMRIAYQPAEVEVENNGHSVEVAYPPGSHVETGGTIYKLEQFHYHAPSEHEASGRSFPMELHFVNESDDGKVLVIGVMVREGEAHPDLAGLVDALPADVGGVEPVPGELNAADLLPPNPEPEAEWSYEGSFTTPPCTEGVSWRIFMEPIELSAAQLRAFTRIYRGNNRPLQPLNGRRVLAGRGA